MPAKTAQPEKLLTPEQVADELSVSADAVRKWCRERLFPGAMRFGVLWRIPRRAVDAFKAQAQAAAEGGGA